MQEQQMLHSCSPSSWKAESRNTYKMLIVDFSSQEEENKQACRRTSDIEANLEALQQFQFSHFTVTHTETSSSAFSRKQLKLQSPWSFHNLLLEASDTRGPENQNCWDSSLKIAINGSIKATFQSNIKHIHSNSFNMAPRGVLVLFCGCVEVFLRKEPSSGKWLLLLVPLWEGTTGNSLFGAKSIPWRNPSQKPLPSPEELSWKWDAQQLSSPTSKCHLQADQ